MYKDCGTVEMFSLIHLYISDKKITNPKICIKVPTTLKTYTMFKDLKKKLNHEKDLAANIIHDKHTKITKILDS